MLFSPLLTLAAGPEGNRSIYIMKTLVACSPRCEFALTDSSTLCSAVSLHHARPAMKQHIVLVGMLHNWPLINVVFTDLNCVPSVCRLFKVIHRFLQTDGLVRFTETWWTSTPKVLRLSPLKLVPGRPKGTRGEEEKPETHKWRRTFNRCPQEEQEQVTIK